MSVKDAKAKILKDLSLVSPVNILGYMVDKIATLEARIEAIERNQHNEEAVTCKTSFIVLICDEEMPGERFTKDGLSFKEWVPVCREFNSSPESTLGMCKLYWKGNNLMADFNYPAKYPHQLYPAVCGSIIQKAQDENGRVIVTKSFIKSIGLCANKNEDERIKTVLEQYYDSMNKSNEVQ